MEPVILSMEPFLLAGIGGDGKDPCALWNRFEALERACPLPGKTGSEGYEIRAYTGGRCDCFVGVPVKDEAADGGYALRRVPGGIYARFAIRPAHGWPANNAAMDAWLKGNGRYRQIADPETGALWAMEQYGEDFQGMEDPRSVIRMLIPITEDGKETDHAL